ANSSQLMLSDPDNLLIQLGLQLPENLTGKIAVSGDGAFLYALSQSGFTVLPVSTIYDNPIAMVDKPVAFVASDQCGVSADKSIAQVAVRNAGKGPLNVQATVLQTGPTFTFPLAGNGGATPGAGGGGPGTGIPIVLPGGGQVMIPPGNNPGAGNGNLANTT